MNTLNGYISMNLVSLLCQPAHLNSEPANFETSCCSSHCCWQRCGTSLAWLASLAGLYSWGPPSWPHLSWGVRQGWWLQQAFYWGWASARYETSSLHSLTLRLSQQGQFFIHSSGFPRPQTSGSHQGSLKYSLDITWTQGGHLKYESTFSMSVF